MRRLLYLLVALAGLLFIALPGALGWLIAREAPRLIEVAEPRLGPWRLVAPRVERGWFGSRLLLDAVAEGRPALALVATLQHGPLAGGGLNWLAGEFTLAEPAKPVLRGAFTLSPAGIVVGGARPAEGVGSGGVRFRVVRAGERAEIAAEALSLPPVLVDLTGSLVAETTDAGARLEGRLAAATVATEEIRLAGVAFRLAGDRTGDSARVDLGATVDEAVEDGGPWRDLRFELALDRLHVPTLATLTRGLRAVARMPAPVEQRREAAVRTLFTALPALLLHQPAVTTLEASGQAPAGRFRAAAQGGFLRAPPAGFVGDFSRLLEVVRFEGRASASRELTETFLDRRIADAPDALWLTPAERVQRREEALRYYEEAGLLARDGDIDVVAVSHEPGDLRINGQPWPVRAEVAR